MPNTDINGLDPQISGGYGPDDSEDQQGPRGGEGVIDTIRRWRENDAHKAESDARKKADEAYAREQYTQEHGGVPPPDEATPPAEQPGGIGHLIGSLKDHVEHYAHRLFGHGLSANHKANSEQGIDTPDSSPAPSSPATSAAPPGTPPGRSASSPGAATTAPGASSAGAIPAGADATNPEQRNATVNALQQASDGKPQQAAPPGRAHSLSHADFDKLDLLAYRAKVAALREGKDPLAVERALNAQRTAFIQGGMMKALSAANQAIMDNDQQGLTQALKNANYYLPDGQDLKLHTDVTGKTQYVDPFNPTIADPTDPNKKVPNWVDVTPEHIQLLAQNVVNPQAVALMIQTARAAGAKIAHEAAQDRVALYGATAKVRNANTAALEAPAKIKLWGSQGRHWDAWSQAQTDKAAAAVAAKNLIPFKDAQKIGDDAGKAAATTLLGQQETIPLQTRDPKTGAMVDNPSLVAGKTGANNEKQPWWGKDAKGNRLGPSDAAGSIAMSSTLAIANAGRMPPQEAAVLGGQIYHLSHIKMVQHMEKGGMVNNFKVDPGDTPKHGYLWTANADGKSGKWRTVNLLPEIGAALVSGVDQSGGEPPELSTDDGMGEEPPENPADYAPAVPPPAQ